MPPESGEVVSYNEYDPYGMLLNSRNGYDGISNVNEKYKFTGKERDIETNYDYFGARYYDSRIGRWLSIDPLADKYPGWSPYAYSLNNPVIYFDPDGREVKVKTEEDAKRFVQDVNSLYSDAPVSYEKVIEEHSFLGIFSWTSEHYVIKADGSDSFDWSQDKFIQATFEVINNKDITFNLAYEDASYKVSVFSPLTLYESGGRIKDFSGGGGANVYISHNGNNTNSPRGVVLMHELIGHGHPVGGNNAYQVDKFYQNKIGYSRMPYGLPHGGYHKDIGWKFWGHWQ